MNKRSKNFLALAGVVTGAGGAYLLWKNRRLLTVNDVTSGESLAYPELLSHVYYGEAEDVLEAAVRAAGKLSRWRVMHTDSDGYTLDAEVETTVGGFLDDVTVYVIPLGDGRSRVTVRSRSRQGRGDLGQNALHIREIQQAMDDALMTHAAI